ncbi:MAG: hypothetical protein ACE5G9_07325 [Nitrospinales bacterium]
MQNQNSTDPEKPRNETPAVPHQTPAQTDKPAHQPVEREIDLNAVFPDETNDLNALFPDADMKRFLKKIDHNKKEIQKMTQNFAEADKPGKVEPRS